MKCKKCEREAVKTLHIDIFTCEKHGDTAVITKPVIIEDNLIGSEDPERGNPPIHKENRKRKKRKKD